MKKILCAVLAAIACLGMAACVPSNMDKAEEKMKKEGYTVIAYTDEEAEGLVGAFTATKMEGLLDIDNVTALLFESSKAAKNYYEGLDNKGSALQDGKWVYWGTEDGIEDFTD